MSNHIGRLEAWHNASKSRSVSIGIDDGHGASCWEVTLRDGEKKLVACEVFFLSFGGSRRCEFGGTLAVAVCGDDMDDWPGLAATIDLALKEAEAWFAKAGEA